MRELTDQKSEGENDKIAIAVTDKPGIGWANHVDDVWRINVDGSAVFNSITVDGTKGAITPPWSAG